MEMPYAIMKRFIRENCIFKGDFQLSAGGSSEFYFDMKRALLNNDFIHALGSYYYCVFQPEEEISMMGGYGTGAALLMPTLLSASVDEARRFNGVLVRESKKHGMRHRIENKISGPHNIMVVDDVLTTGKSINIACEAFGKIEYDVKKIFVLINRADEETTKAISAKHKAPVVSVFKTADFDLEDKP